jgi:RNA polymerase sigma-70 factor (ECF subfamily)
MPLALPRPFPPVPGSLAEDIRIDNPGPDPDAERDAESVRRVVAGDREAFGALVARYGRRVHDLALRMLREPHDAEDVSQQAFLNAYRALPRFDGRRPFRHWLLRIATNLCRNRLAERKRRGLSFALAAGVGDEVAFEPESRETPAPAPSDAAADAERVRVAIGRLPEAHRLAVILHYTQRLSLEEMSEITEVPVATLKTHLHRARAALRRLLEPRETSRPGSGTEA